MQILFSHVFSIKNTGCIFVGERVNVTILGAKFGQSNGGSGSTGEGRGAGGGLEKKGKNVLPSPHLPPPKAYPSSLDRRLGGPHLL